MRCDPLNKVVGNIQLSVQAMIAGSPSAESKTTLLDLSINESCYQRLFNVTDQYVLYEKNSAKFSKYESLAAIIFIILVAAVASAFGYALAGAKHQLECAQSEYDAKKNEAKFPRANEERN